MARVDVVVVVAAVTIDHWRQTIFFDNCRDPCRICIEHFDFDCLLSRLCRTPLAVVVVAVATRVHEICADAIGT